MKLIGPQTMRDVTTLRAEGRYCVLIVECVACMCVCMNWLVAPLKLFLHFPLYRVCNEK